jgi:predicted nucleic acid-binding protein
VSGTGYLLDTNIVLYLLQGEAQISALIQGKDIYLSYITEMELLSFNKLSSSEKSQIELLIREVFIIDMNSNIKKSAIFLRSKYAISLPDSIIAASSIFMNIPFVSADKDFKKIKEIDLVFLER